MYQTKLKMPTSSTLYGIVTWRIYMQYTQPRRFISCSQAYATQHIYHTNELMVVGLVNYAVTVQKRSYLIVAVCF